MHIAMITPFPNKTNRIDGGVAGVAKYLADALTLVDNVTLSIVVTRGISRKTTCEDWGRYKVYRLGILPLASFFPWLAYDAIFGRRRLFAFLRKIDPDLLHFQGLEFLPLNCPWTYLVTIHGIKELDDLWHSDVRTRRLRSIVSKITQEYSRLSARNIILISEYVRNFVRNLQFKNTWLIENPVADSYFGLDWHGQRGRIFSCGRVIPRKNIHGLIKAFSLLCHNDPEAQLRIAGSLYADPGYADKCIRLVKSLSLGNRVHFLGNLSISEIQQELILSNCLVIPSFQETAPLSIEEAMAVGVPIVGSNLCGLPYMIEDGITGFVVDPNDIRCIAAVVHKIISNSQLSKSMSLKARDVARKRFKASYVASLTLDVYRQLLQA